MLGLSQRIGNFVGSKNEKKKSKRVIATTKFNSIDLKDRKNGEKYSSDESEHSSEEIGSVNESFLHFGSARKVRRSKLDHADSKGRNDLSSFDICIEAIDSLAANSRSANAKTQEDRKNNDQSNVVDSYVRVSADGALIHVPGDLIMSSTVTTLRSNRIDVRKSYIDDHLNLKSEPNKNNQISGKQDALPPLEDGSSSSQDQMKKALTVESGINDAYKTYNNANIDFINDGMDLDSSIVVGRDDVIDGDRISNGFSLREIDPVRVSQYMKSALDTLNLTAAFCHELVEIRQKNGSCLLESVKSKLSSDGINEIFQSRHEMGWLAQLRGNLDQNELPNDSKVGPFLANDSSLRKAFDAVGFFYAKQATLSTERSSGIDTHVLDSLRKTIDLSSRRAKNRQRAMQEVRENVEQSELKLHRLKAEASVIRKKVKEVESEIDRRLGDKEKSLKKQTRLKSEFRELINQESALQDVYAGSGFIGDIDPDVSSLMPSRSAIEGYFNLHETRLAASEADQAVDDAATELLNALSSQDTTNRSAQLAAETCMLSMGTSQAKYLRRLVSAEKESLLQQLKDIEDVEKVLNEIDVRDDINRFVEKDKSIRQGQYVHGEGIASALAVLNFDSLRSCDEFDENALSEGNRWSEQCEIGIVSREEIENLIETIFEIDQFDMFTDRESNELDSMTQFFESSLRPDNPEARAHRASVCHALNNQRSIETRIRRNEVFNTLGYMLRALLDGCSNVNSDVANAKMCMMLSETFYTENVSNTNITIPPTSPSRSGRLYIKSMLIDHKIWSDDGFWEQALYQCISEALSRCRIVNDVHKASIHDISLNNETSEQSPFQREQDLKWYDLSHEERIEAASQLHSVVFSQIAALSHSMSEFGCDYEVTTSFIRRLSIRHQLPVSRRTMLIDHIEKRRSKLSNSTRVHSLNHIAPNTKDNSTYLNDSDDSQSIQRREEKGEDFYGDNPLKKGKELRTNLPSLIDL